LNGKIAFLHILVSFGVGSIWIALTTVLAEKYGSKIGGFIGGLPSTAAVSLFFIGLTQSPESAAQAATVFPLSYAFTGLFLVLYALLWRLGFLSALLLSLSAWFGLSSFVVVFRLENYPLSVGAYILFFVVAVYLLEHRMKLPSTGRETLRFSLVQVLGRAGFGGGVVAFAVFMSMIGGPVAGGVFSAFPAAFVSILVISYKTKGLPFSRAMTKPLLVTGMVTIFLFAAGVKFLYPGIGLWLGTLGSLLVSAVSALLTFLFIRKHLT
jgi:MFS family permease